MFLANILWSRRYGAIAGDNPWDAGHAGVGHGFAAAPYNFRHLPTVRGREPIWEDPDGTRPSSTGLATDTREVLVTTMHDAVPDHRYHMAGDSIWPFLAALVVGGVLRRARSSTRPRSRSAWRADRHAPRLVLAVEGAGADPPPAGPARPAGEAPAP